MIKNFEQFKNDTVEEGLFSAFKTRNQIMKLQSMVVDKYEELLKENPENFHDGQSVMNAVESFAFNTYKQVVTSKDAISFSQWWKEFEKANAYMLDRTIFNLKK